jgi:dTDP-glucose 4,6-dehydratase
VRDNCAAIDLVLHKGLPGEIYNIGGSNELTNLEITEKILSQLEKPVSLVQHVADRLGHDFRYSVDTSKISNLGWRPEKSFEDALKETIAWYKNNEKWWRELI